MDRYLKRHPQSTGASDHRVTTSVIRPSGSRLELGFEVSGDLANLNIPPFDEIKRGDKLWEQTCFEIFVRSAKSDAYCEFNFSPTGEWAAYRFDDYRAGMRPLEGLDVSSMSAETNAAQFRLFLTIDIKVASAVPIADDWHVGISAILQETSGAKSYWALAHPSGKPDFHHSDCFVLELGAQEQS